MANTVKHNTTWVAGTKLHGTTWNEEHDFSGGSTGNVLVRDTTATDGVAWQAKPVYDARDYGAVGDGTTDDATGLGLALTAAGAAGGGIVYLPAGTYRHTTQLSIPANVIVQGVGYASVLKKAGNVDSATMGFRSVLVDLYIDGQGATFTGRGVVISTGASDNLSWRRLVRCEIMDTASYGVEFTAAIAGYSTEMRDCRIVPHTASVAAVKYPDAAETNGNRSMIGCWTASNPLVDFASCNDALMVGCQGGTPIFSLATAKKVVAVGNRFSSTGVTFTVKGISHTFTGNVMADPSVTFAASCAGIAWSGNTIASGGTITDSATGVTDGNAITYTTQFYVPTWASGGTQPVLSNGTLNGAYARKGETARVNIRLTAGSSTTFGTGLWSFTLPFTSSRYATGSAYIEDNSGVSVYVGTAYIVSGANYCYIVSNQSASSYVDFDTPMVWAVNDLLVIDIEYFIA